MEHAVAICSCRNPTRLGTCTSHQIDTSEIVHRSNNATCPAILVHKSKLVEKLLCSFFNPAISLYIYYDQYEKYGEKKNFPRLVSMEMAAIFDFRALAKVHLISKPLLQMQ